MKKTLKPALRFKGFTDTWEQYKLGDLGFFKSNGVDKLSKPNEIPVNLLNYMDVYSRRKVSSKNANELMQVTAKPCQLIENSVMKNDVFFTPTSETPEDIGRVYVIEETLNNTVYSYHLMRFRPNQGTYYPNFPNYSLMTENVRKQFFLAAKGVQRYVISKTDFESIVDTIPEYKEQVKIGEFFRSIDQLITLNQLKYKQLINIKKALLDKMFPKNGEFVPQLRFKGFTDNWEQRKIGECFSERCESMPNGELISVTINEGVKKFSELNRHDNSNDDKSKYKKVCVGDLPYNSMRMWQGASGYCPYEGIVSPAYTVLIPNLGIDSKCISYLFKRPDMIHCFQVNSQGITSDNWNLKYPKLSEIIINISSNFEEQIKISELFSSFDSLITLHQRKYEKLVNIKKALLQKMFV